VTTENFLPVNVFAAVTVTPGSNTLPLRTLPKIGNVIAADLGGSCALARHITHTAQIRASAMKTISPRKNFFNWATPPDSAESQVSMDLAATLPEDSGLHSSLASASTAPAGSRSLLWAQRRRLPACHARRCDRRAEYQPS